MIHVVCVHTAMALVEPLTAIFKEYLPEVTVNHIADSSLIKEVIANNQVTPAVRRRLLSYYNGIPVFRIDQPMAAEAVKNYDRIGVISTLPTTLDPTCRLLRNEAEKAGRKVTLVEGLADGAFAAGQSGDGATHDRLIAEAAQRIASQVDMFVLAQGSMARMEQRLSELTGKPVLSSPILGVKGLRKFLNL